MTPDTALRLERLFGMDAQFWLNLQLAWDLYHAGRSPAAKAIRKIRRFPGLTTVRSGLSIVHRLGCSRSQMRAHAPSHPDARAPLRLSRLPSPNRPASSSPVRSASCLQMGTLNRLAPTKLPNRPIAQLTTPPPTRPVAKSPNSPVDHSATGRARRPSGMIPARMCGALRQGRPRGGGP